MTRYKQGTRIQKSNTAKIAIIAGVIIAAMVVAGIYASMTGMLKPSADNQPMIMHIHPKLY